jgi:hypothetical protein
VRAADDLGPAMDALFAHEYREVIYAPIDDDVAGAFEELSLQLKSFVLDAPPRRRLAVVVDETSLVDVMNGPFQWVLRCASRHDVHVMLTTHRPIDIPVTVRAIADHWLTFPVRQEHDLRVIAERCSPATADVVATLPDRTFAHWNDERATLRVNRVPAQWFIPLMTPSPMSLGSPTTEPALVW